jgi:hypothetical protein
LGRGLGLGLGCWMRLLRSCDGCGGDVILMRGEEVNTMALFLGEKVMRLYMKQMQQYIYIRT